MQFVATTAVFWQMMYQTKDWFIHLLILSNYMNMTKQLYTNQISSRWKKVNKISHFTVSQFKCCTEKNLAW